MDHGKMGRKVRASFDGRRRRGEKERRSGRMEVAINALSGMKAVTPIRPPAAAAAALIGVLPREFGEPGRGIEER
jgi:hypothetical protein